MAVLDFEPVEIVTQEGAACVRSKDGSVSCWIYAPEGNVAPPPPWGDKAQGISWGDTLCGITPDSTIVCETDRECKDKMPPSYEIKELVRPTVVAASMVVHCAAQADGRVQCWGDPENPESCSTVAYYVEGLNAVVDLYASEDAFCALSTDNTIKCWGENRFEYLGVSEDEIARSNVPVEVPLGAPAVKLRMSEGTVIALTAGGEVWTWGRRIMWNKDDHGPQKVEGIDNAIDIVAGRSQGCALLADHEIRCFGFGLHSRLTRKAEHHEYEDKSVWINPRQFTIWPDAPSYEDEVSK